LERPYQLEPLLATQMPVVRYYDQHDVLLPDNAPADQIAYSVYEISIKKGVMYQSHPAFASQPAKLQVNHLSDFPNLGTREVTADDFVYQIKRIAQPALNSPILSVMNAHIVGLSEFSDSLLAAYNDMPDKAREIGYMDLRAYDFKGATVIDPYTYQIKVIGKYPQFMYWLAMLFFSPMPWDWLKKILP
jgi:ABC-type transport system substrate-binding protein